MDYLVQDVKRGHIVRWKGKKKAPDHVKRLFVDPVTSCKQGTVKNGLRIIVIVEQNKQIVCHTVNTN